MKGNGLIFGVVIAVAVAAVIFALTKSQVDALIFGCGCMVGLMAYRMWFVPRKPTIVHKSEMSSHEG